MPVTKEEWSAASKEQRAAMFPLSQQGDDAANQLMQRCGQFAKENPSLALTLLYLMMSLIGLLFQSALLYRFGLNVLPYLEITDFLLSALTHPKVVAVLIVMLLGVFAMFSFERRTRRNNFRYAVSTEASFQRWWVPKASLWMPLLFLIYLVMAAWVNGNKFAKDIRAGEGRKLEIQLVYPLQQNEQKTLLLQNASLISRTASYLFIYHEGRVKVLPHANIAALLPELTPEPKPPMDAHTKSHTKNPEIPVEPAAAVSTVDKKAELTPTPTNHTPPPAKEQPTS